MDSTLLTLRIRCKRDLLLARRRARQVAHLLGIDAPGQLAFSCGVFEAAYLATLRLGRITLAFRLSGEHLQACFSGAATREDSDSPMSVPFPCVQKLLPRPLSMDREDLAYVLRQTVRPRAGDLFEELRQQNRETLRVLAELQRAEAARAQQGVHTSGVAAA